MQNTIEVYNGQVVKYQMTTNRPRIDDFVLNDDSKISWSRNLKRDLKRGKLAEYSDEKIRPAV
jgi:predicted helicase